jgi:hypothetical protein
MKPMARFLSTIVILVGALSFVAQAGEVSDHIERYILKDVNGVVTPRIVIAGQAYDFRTSFTDPDNLKILTATISTAISMDKKVMIGFDGSNVIYSIQVWNQ